MSVVGWPHAEQMLSLMAETCGTGVASLGWKTHGSARGISRKKQHRGCHRISGSASQSQHEDQKNGDIAKGRRNITSKEILLLAVDIVPHMTQDSYTFDLARSDPNVPT